MEQKFDTLLFDLDDTLYPFNSGIFPLVGKNIEDYMTDKLGIEKSKVSTVCPLLYKNYGTTLAGLRAIGYNIDYDDFHSFVHGRGLPYHKIKRDPLLKNMLENMHIRKLIFTNSDMDHAMRVLERLGLKECFDGIICFESLNKRCLSQPWDKAAAPEIFDIAGHLARSGGRVDKLPKTPVLCKPNVHAMETALKMFNVNPFKAIFFDDSVRNIQAGKQLGLRTVLIGKSHRVDGADHAMESIHDITEVLPELL